MSEAATPLVIQAIERLKVGERRAAAGLLHQHFHNGPPPGDRWRSVAMVLMQIGEIDMALEAARRAAEPPTLDRLLHYWGLLASHGRADEAVAMMDRLPSELQEHPSVLHFRGTVATEKGQFEVADQFLRRSLSKAPGSFSTWFALAMIKRFSAGDPDFEAMERLLRDSSGTPGAARSQVFYALGKAYEDIGDYDRAFSYFQQGSTVRQGHYDRRAAEQAADRVISEFTPQNLARLRPSGAAGSRSIFVTGLPRSGTTLVQEMLTAHSKVATGDEVNLFQPALIPTIDNTLRGALAYQERSRSDDPWGDIAHDYAHFIDMRFRTPGLIVDKSLGQSTLIGLMLHSSPDARIVWLRRNPADTALSCFKTSFTAATHWSWSIEDIAAHFRIEDRLFDHWRSVFPDCILVVPYEELVSEPTAWIGKIAEHVGLEMEPGMERFYEKTGTVRTASVKQVRAPVSTSQVGSARRYGQFLEQFERAYAG